MRSPSNILGKLEALKKLFFSWDIQIAVIFSLSFCTSQIQWCHERTGLHKLEDVVFGITPKPFYIAPN